MQWDLNPSKEKKEYWVDQQHQLVPLQHMVQTLEHE